MGERQPVLLIGGLDRDVGRLEAALAAAGRESVVHRAAGLTEAAAALFAPPGPAALFVSLGPGQGEAAQWRRLLEGAGFSGAWIVLAEPSQEAEAQAWEAAGAHGSLFRPALAGLPALLARIARGEQARAVLDDRERRWRDCTTELVTLARSPSFHGEDVAAALREITEAATRGAQVARCGVWLFDEARTHLTLVDLYEAPRQRHDRGVTLSVTEHRGYVDALSTQRLLAVPDVHTDARTRGFVEDYFAPAGITSTIDVAVRRGGALVGSLCLEHVGPPRTWQTSEEAFAGALADLVSLALEGAERARVEVALRQTERRLRDLFFHANDAIFLHRVERDGSVWCEDVNPAAARMMGLPRERLVGSSLGDAVPPTHVAQLEARFRHAVQSGAPQTYEDELPTAQGSQWVNASLVPLTEAREPVQRLAVIARDVTAVRAAEALQRSFEAQVAQAQKHEALGRLASHIAHDVNNLLTVIVAHAQRLEGLAGKPREVAESILRATDRGRELTQQVLTFGRGRPLERKPLELEPLARETLRLLEPTAGQVRFEVRVAPRVPRVAGDAGQLHQVLTNLCTNALQAMPSGQGTLTVSVDTAEVDAALAQRHPQLRVGRWVRLTVADTGVGMDDVTRERIFEPFFSSRAEGQGTGLGLAVVQGIVQAHGGAVSVESQPGRGAQFHVYLPPVPEAPSQPGAGQHLMLVDDHPGMARVSARLLETLGYRTSVFDDPREALKAFEATPRAFDALLTDLSMPELSGEQLAQAVRAVRPELPIIISSGLAAEVSDDLLRRVRIDAVLVKPWRLEEAVAALKRVLG